MSMFGRRSVCPYWGRLEAFWDCEAAPEQRQQIEAHLSECTACRQRLEELQGLMEMLKAYRIPAAGWRSDAEFWQDLVRQLPPRAIQAQASQVGRPSPFLAPVSLVVSSLALQGVAALVLIICTLYQWQLLPTALSAAFAPALQLLLGPVIWQRSQVLYSSLMTPLAPLLAAPGQVWLLAFQAVVSASLLLLAGLHIGWLVRWLRNPSSLQAMRTTE